MKRLILSLSLVGLLSACAVNALNTEPEVPGLEGEQSVQRLSNPPNGASATLTLGNQLLVRLPANVTTGYMWSFVTVSGEETLSLVSQDYVQNPNPDNLVGVGGRAEFVFTGAVVGDAELQFNYSRPNGPPDDQRLIQITVID